MNDGQRPFLLLRVSGATVRFGGIVALGDASFAVGTGQICGLIGSGKTTLFNCISGSRWPGKGEVRSARSYSRSEEEAR